MDKITKYQNLVAGLLEQYITNWTGKERGDVDILPPQYKT